MRTVDIYDIGEEVLIRAKVTDIIVENGEVKYRIKAEHSNNDLDHKYTDHQLMPYSGAVNKEEDEEDEPADYFEEAERNLKKSREEHRQTLS